MTQVTMNEFMIELEELLNDFNLAISVDKKKGCILLKDRTPETDSEEVLIEWFKS